MELREIFGLFAEEQPKDFKTINTSHGEDDFREAVVAYWNEGALPPEFEDRMVIKLAVSAGTVLVDNSRVF